MSRQYSSITEFTGSKASAAQLRRLSTRYSLACAHANKGDVLEIACGSGQGLGNLAQSATRVADLDLNRAKQIASKTFRNGPNALAESELLVGGSYGPETLSNRISHKKLRLAKRIVVQLGLMPKSLAGRAVLKRILSGRLETIPAELMRMDTAWRNSVQPIPRATRSTKFAILHMVSVRKERR